MNTNNSLRKRLSISLGLALLSATETRPSAPSDRTNYGIIGATVAAATTFVAGYCAWKFYQHSYNLYSNPFFVHDSILSHPSNKRTVQHAWSLHQQRIEGAKAQSKFSGPITLVINTPVELPGSIFRAWWKKTFDDYPAIQISGNNYFTEDSAQHELQYKYEGDTSKGTATFESTIRLSNLPTK